MDSPDIIFGTVFGQSGLNFWDCFLTVQAEFLGLFSDGRNRIFGILFGQSECVCCFFYVLLQKFE